VAALESLRGSRIASRLGRVKQVDF
jgi:hypothetical protein